MLTVETDWGVSISKETSLVVGSLISLGEVFIIKEIKCKREKGNKNKQTWLRDLSKKKSQTKSRLNKKPQRTIVYLIGFDVI